MYNSLNKNHLLVSFLLGLVNSHGSILGPVFTLYLLTLLTYFIHFSLFVFSIPHPVNTAYILKYHRLPSPAQASLLRSEFYPKMPKGSAAIPKFYLKLNSGLCSAKIASSAVFPHFDATSVTHC